MKRMRTALGPLACSALLVGCAATPATDVKVPTMSMEQAYAASRATLSDVAAAPESRIVRAVVAPGRPAPVVVPPDIRLAYVYEWIDAEGSLHYPGWVAIQVEGFKWVMPEAGAVPMDGSVARPPIARKPEAHRDAKP